MKAKVIPLILSMFFVIITNSLSQIPKLINYQGKLTDANSLPVNGTRSITFSIYESATGGSALWSETHASVTVTDGIFSILLGSVTDLGNLEFDKPYYLGIKIDSGTELTPRKQIVSTAYAMRAEDANNADLLDGMDSSSLLSESGGNPIFLGVTPHSYNADDTRAENTLLFKGINYFNSICQIFYYGSHFCTLEEFLTSGGYIDYRSPAWLFGQMLTQDSNCSMFTSSSSSLTGYTTYGFRSCNDRYPVACCK